MRSVRRPVLQAVCAVILVAAGLAAQFATRAALVQDVGIVAIVAGLAALAMTVPSLVTEPPSRGGDRAAGPPPTGPQ